MNRSAFTSAAVVVCTFALAAPALAQTAKKTTPAAPAKTETKADQAKPATPAATAPAAPAKFAVPVKGLAHIEIMQGPSKKVGNDIVTVTKVKNVSDAPIALLRLDELWYNKSREQVTGDTQTIRRPFQPGEVIEITTHSPAKPDVQQSQYMFSHANGKVDVKRVKSFTDGSGKDAKDAKAAPKAKK
jgi:hypothetical protein